MAGQIAAPVDSQPSSEKKLALEDGVAGDLVSIPSIGENYAVTELDDERFNLWSVLGVQYTTSATPLSICGFMQFTLAVGGSPFFFWGFPGCGCVARTAYSQFRRAGLVFPTRRRYEFFPRDFAGFC